VAGVHRRESVHRGSTVNPYPRGPAIARDVDLARVTGGTRDIEDLFIQLLVEVLGKAERELVRIGGVGLGGATAKLVKARERQLSSLLDLRAVEKCNLQHGLSSMSRNRRFGVRAAGHFSGLHLRSLSRSTPSLLSM
jgi:hypothetical protein